MHVHGSAVTSHPITTDPDQATARLVGGTVTYPGAAVTMSAADCRLYMLTDDSRKCLRVGSLVKQLAFRAGSGSGCRGNVGVKEKN